MPYSCVLMTSIFIKRLCGRGGAGGDLCVPPASRAEAVMRTELQRSAIGATTVDAHEPTESMVSTLKLCNANFGRG
jgi:hypothetical protein